MKPRILIITDPPAAPGYLPRVRFLCDYLYEKGYSIILLTEEYEKLLFTHNYPIYTISTYGYSLFDWAVKSLWSLLTDWHNRHFAAQAEKILKNEEFDMVLCSSFSCFPLPAAWKIAQKRHIPLVTDIRDLDEQVDHSHYQYHHQQWWTKPFLGLYRAINVKRRNHILRQANQIISISPWHVDFLKTFNSNVHLIYNGFDPSQFYAKDVSTQKFRITYIGSLFSFQDPTPLQMAVQELQLPDIEVVFHTPQKDPVLHTEIGNTIRQSSIMLVLTARHTHGMMTTKFFEALGCEKPILCIPSDNGLLAQTIQDTNAGIATDDVEAIKAFIVDKYEEWKAKGFTHQPIENKEQFNRLHQATEFENILLQTIL